MAKMPSRAVPAPSPIPDAVAERVGLSTNGHAALSAAPDPVDSAMEQFFAELDAPDVEVYLSRQDPVDPREYAHLAVIDAKDFSLEYVKQIYGGGRYKARVRRGGKPYTWLRQVSFAIDARLYPPRTKPLHEGHEAPAASPAGNSPSPELLELRTMVRELCGLTAQLATRPAAPERDPVEMALRIAEAVKAPPQSFSVAEILTLVESARSNGMRLGRELAEKAPEQDSVLAFAREIAPPILGALQKNATPGPAPTQAATGLHLVRADRPAAPAPPSSSDSTDPMGPSSLIPEWARPLQRWIPQLLIKQQQGKNPEVYAHLLLEELDHDTYERLAEASAAPDFVESVLNAAPGLTDPGRRAWFAEFLAEVRETIAADAAADEADEQERADAQ